MNKEERLLLFKRELESIQDVTLRTLAEKLLTDADEYFFMMPASTTGKYHPAFSLGDGGLVRHTKAVVYFAQSLGTAKMYDQHKIDLLTVAAIAHDIKKKGENGSAYTTKDHPQCAANFILNESSPSDGISDDDMELLTESVKRHMGQWGEDKPLSDFDFTLHEADYIASRKVLSFVDGFFGDDVNIPYVVNETVNTETSSSGYNRFEFGKYSGKTFEEVYNVDSRYLYWAAENLSNVAMKTSIKKFLVEKKK